MTERKQVLMRLPEGVNVLKENLYRNFKNRAKRHSDFLYRDKTEKPTLFRIHKRGSLFDSTFTVLIVRKSFDIIYDNATQKKEIGFIVIFRHLNGGYSKLTVLKQGKAYYEPCKKPKKKK